MPLPKLFLHIGTNKTGTSSIQRFLASHAEQLTQSGVLYPAAGRRGDAHYALSRALGFAHSKKNPQADAERAALRSALTAEVLSNKLSTLVISSEDFMLRGNVPRLREFFSDYDCRIVVYLRRHDHWWLSAYNQAVKMVAMPPWAPGVNAYVQFSRRRKGASAGYRELLERWAAVFGVSNIIVRPYEAIQNDAGVVADFVCAIGLPQLAPVAARDAVRVNESLGPDTIHLLDLVQRADISPAMREHLKQKLLAESPPSAAVDAMRPRFRRRLIDENRADYEYIARTYLGSADGILFKEAEPVGDESWEPPEVPGTLQVLSKIVNLLDTAS